MITIHLIFMQGIKINKISYIKDYILELEFSDGCIKQFDFLQLINFQGIAEQLKDIEYFKNARIIDNGRAFGWENGYDCCAYWSRYFAKDTQNEWIDFDDSIDLKQRIKITQQKLRQVKNLVTTS